ncbi:MAG: enoyl-CoA hydratase/isomerase family protein [Chloroflexi bacterium]|nr:enoyl-CoA hydratase/isomerase family protein [Chloroflexota bacterium]
MADKWRVVHEYPDITYERLEDAGVARLVLNRPERRNALNQNIVDGALAAMEEIRADPEIRVIVTKGNGPVYSSGLDLYHLRSLNDGPPRDWDRPTPTVQWFLALQDFPRITIAQVHGYCLGGSLALMNSHDLVFAADNVQIGMPEILRGSFGQMATSTLYHSGIPQKKAAFMALLGRNITGAEADRWGLVTMAVPEAELEEVTTGYAREIASRHLVPLQNAKIAARFGSELSQKQAMMLDQLVGARQRLGIDPLGHVEEYLHSQKGGASVEYRRPDA